MKNFVSVIIPAYNSVSSLKVLLKSFLSLSFREEDYEIIVVDNNSNDSPQILATEFPRVKWTTEKRQSSYAARNKGVILARGNILAFTDADCIPCKDWLNEGVSLIESGKADSVGGQIDFVFSSNKPTVYEYVDSIRFLNQMEYVKNGFAATANLFVKRDVFIDVGGFDLSLFSGGDYEFGKRMQKKEYKIVYSSKAKVYHQARNSLAELKNKTKRIALGQKKLGIKVISLGYFLPRYNLLNNNFPAYFSIFNKIKIFFVYNYIHYLNIYYRYLYHE